MAQPDGNAPAGAIAVEVKENTLLAPVPEVNSFSDADTYAVANPAPAGTPEAMDAAPRQSKRKLFY